jgi:protein-S-isoprenylcysteine O-methyltransferase Ste14
LGSWLFRFRSYLPIPWIIALVLFCDFELLSFLFGFVISAFGEAMRLWAVSWIGSQSRTRSEETGELCQDGPYQLFRNPLYIGNIAIYTGLCISGASPILALFVFSYSSLYYSFIVQYEEEQWKGNPKYKEYLSTTPRWLPKLNRLGTSLRVGSIYPALRSERSSLSAWVILLTLVLIVGQSNWGW